MLTFVASLMGLVAVLALGLGRVAAPSKGERIDAALRVVRIEAEPIRPHTGQSMISQLRMPAPR